MSAPGRGVHRAAGWLLLGLAAASVAVAARPASTAPPLARAQADSLAAAPASPARDKALVEWARRADANDLAWLLRRGPDELAAAEAAVVDAAIAATPVARVALRQRLLTRRAVVALATRRGAGRAARRDAPPLPDLAALRPYASVFRIAVLLPDVGEYAGYSRAVRAALAEGLAWGRTTDAPVLALDTLGTADSDPARVAEALERAASRSDIVVGELLSVPTLSLATATRLQGLTLVSATATDERIGRVGPQVFQVGPGVEARARALAGVVLGSEPHTLAIAGSTTGVRGPFAAAFAREVESRGGTLARRDVVPAGGAELAQLADALKSSGADVLFWDGSTRDAEALFRVLAVKGVALRLCGGPALAPEGMRPNIWPLLEGVAYVADDWRLPDDTRARLDSLAVRAGARPGSLWTRGFLAGRQIAFAVDSGARTAGEVATALRNSDAGLAAGGFLDVARDGARLPVFVVRGGRVLETTAAGADQ